MDIIFDSILNARDLGSLTGAGGKIVKSNCLIRSAHLHDASDNDILILKQQYRLKRIFDFRSLDEVVHLKDRHVPGATNHLLPTIDMQMEKMTGQAIPQEAFLDLEKHIVNYAFYPEVQQMAREMYPSLILSEFSQLQYATFLRLIIETPDGGILWHCFQGKDRTGWGAAFLLAILGVEREQIIADFDLSNRAYQKLVDKLNTQIAQLGGGDNEMDVIRAFMGVSTQNFINTLNLIDNEFGGMIPSLHQKLFISKADVDTLRNRYLA